MSFCPANQSDGLSRASGGSSRRAPGFLFILGRGRSGTTLIGRILGSHPAVLMPPEGFFIKNLCDRYRDLGAEKHAIDSFVRDFFAERRMRTWGLGQDALRRVLGGRTGPIDFEQTCGLVYDAYAESIGRSSKEVRWLGDKNPHYGLFAKQLAARFSDARFLFVYRDPRDNVCSYRRVPFDSSSVGALAERWATYNRNILEAEADYGDRFFRLGYETLVGDPVGSMQKVCSFLGIPFEESMLAFHGSEPKAFFGRGQSWHQRLGSALDASSLKRWRKEMTEEECALVHACCGETAARLGYDLDGPQVRAGRLDVARARISGRLRSAMEWVLFQKLPLAVRVRWINYYRARTGRD